MVLGYTTDGGCKHRIEITRSEVTDTGDVAIGQSEKAFQITFDALAPAAGTTLATWFTNDPSFYLALV